MQKNNQYNIEAYNKVEKKILNSLSVIDGVISVYTFGNIKAPGNSDIDWLIGINLSQQTTDKIIEVFEKLDEHEKFMAYAHYPIIIDFEDMKFFNYIRNSDSLIYKIGEKVNFEMVSKDILLYQSVDLLIQYYPNNLSRINDFTIREQYQIINAFRHIYALIEKVMETNLVIPEEILSIINKNNEMRMNQGLQESTIELITFFKESSQILLNYAKELKCILSQHIESNYLEEKIEKDNIFFYNTLFTKNKIMYSQSYNIESKFTNAVYCEPIIFYYFFNLQYYLKNDLCRAIFKRNKVLSNYIYFNSIFNKNRTIYQPWWMKTMLADSLYKDIKSNNNYIKRIIEN